MYIFHPGVERTEAIFCQHLYCSGIRNAFQKEVTGCDMCQRTKRPTKQYGELTDKLAKETP